MTRHIDNIHFTPLTPFTYRVEFDYLGDHLAGPEMPRTATQAEVVAALVAYLTDYDAQRNTSNYEILRSSFEGQSADI